MKIKRKWAVLSLCLAVFATVLGGCNQAEEVHTDGDGHNHKEGDGHQHKPGDKH